MDVGNDNTKVDVGYWLDGCTRKPRKHMNVPENRDGITSNIARKVNSICLWDLEYLSSYKLFALVVARSDLISWFCKPRNECQRTLI